MNESPGSIFLFAVERDFGVVDAHYGLVVSPAGSAIAHGRKKCFAFVILLKRSQRIDATTLKEGKRTKKKKKGRRKNRTDRQTHRQKS